MDVHGKLLRHAVVISLLSAGRSVTVDELVQRIERDHGPIRGRAGKAVSDALRWEVAKRRVVHESRGIYAPGRVPRSTQHWMRATLTQAATPKHRPPH